MPLRRGNLDARNGFDREAAELPIVVVVRQSDAVQAAVTRAQREKSNANWVEQFRGPLVAVEESCMSVKVDCEHVCKYAADRPLVFPPKFYYMDADEAGTAGDLAATDDMEYERVVVLNPVSGNGDHAEEVRELAAEHGFTILETREEDDAIEFAEQAAENGAEMVAAAGGDGTLNEVVRGLVSADALDSVTFGVIPAGTGNNFAENIGVTSIEHAFEVLEHGERRRVDLGTANDRDFINSCVGGLTADASVETDSEQKERLGILAYVVNTLQLMADFDGVPLTVKASSEGEVSWSGDAVFVLVGNGRRFPAKGRTQANMEDGLLNITIIEEMPAPNLVGEALLQRLFGTESDNVTHLHAPTVEIDIHRNQPVQFSLDGEMGEWDDLTLGVLPRALELPVGSAYEPIPGDQTDDGSGF